MNKNEFEARLLAAVHLYCRIKNEQDDVVVPGLSEIRRDEFEDFVGKFHALVGHYEETLERMNPHI